MKKHSLKLAIAASAMTLIFAGCGDDVLVSEEVSQAFTTVSELDKDDCNSKSEGSMAFVKSESTMYVCTDGEWIALKDEDAIEYRCTTKSVKKDGKTGIEIICDGESIGTVYNGEKGDKGEPGTPGKKGDDGDNGDSVDMDELNDLINKSIADGLNDISADLGEKLSADSAKITKNLGEQLNKATKEMGEDLDSKLSSASAKHDNDVKDLNKKLSSASKTQEDLNKKLSSASAKHDNDVKDLNSKLSSASAKSEKDNKDLNSKLSSASKTQEDLDKKLSSLADEYDKSCKIIDVPETDENDKVIAVTVKCGTAEKEFVINLEDENLKNVYKKHVVVRFPVHATKETQTDDIYEEIWKNLKGGDNAALTVMDLDDKLNANGKMFVKDLFATARKSFVTVEETNGKVVEYKVVRLEGDLEVTNMSTPIAQLRVKLNLQNAVGFNLATTEVIYNALVDLTDSDPNVEDASDTVVIDFLTDYKAERVKTLAKGDAAKFAEASAQANEELAKALAMDAFEDNQIKAFEHYLPGEKEVGLNEYFNSIVWVMALIDQNDKIPNFNKIYTEFRSVFAENGDFNKSIKTVYAGRQHDMYFVDYLALLIDANFYKWSCGWNCLSNLWRDTDAPYYKILQKGFVSAYGLDVSKTKEIVANNTEVKNGTSTRIQKIESANGYFRYFEYLESKKVWIPADALTDRIAAFEVGQCKTTIDKKTYFHTFEGVDRNVICKCSENSGCDWIETYVCVGRQEGDRGYHYVNGKVEAYVCVKDGCGDESSCESLISVNPERLSSSSSNASSSSYVSEEEENIKLAEKLANDKNSSLYLGKCDMSNDGTEKEFDKKSAKLSTTTGYVTMVCEGKKKWWREKTEFEYQFGLCNETVMNKAELKHGASDWYKCDYKDVDDKYEWVGTSWYEYELLKKVCHYGIAERKTYDEQGNVTGVENEGKIVEYEDRNGGVKYYICRTEDYTDNPGNHIHDWDDNVSVDEFCRGTNVTPMEKMVDGEDLGTECSFDEQCTYDGTTYIRKSNGSWIGPKQYKELQCPALETVDHISARGNQRIQRINSNDPVIYMIYVNGYKNPEPKVYKCTESSCGDEPMTVGTAVEELNEANDFMTAWKLMGDSSYKKVKPGEFANPGIVYKSICIYNSGDCKQGDVLVASDGRRDWHVAGPDDYFGECNVDVMKEHKIETLGEGDNALAYKCDCELDYENTEATLAFDASTCRWQKASDREVTLNDACSADRAHASDAEKTFDSEEKYVCDVFSFRSANHAHDWVDMTPVAWCVKNMKVLDANNDVYAICSGNTVDHKTYVFVKSSGDFDVENMWTAEEFFYNWYSESSIPCNNNEKYIHSFVKGNGEFFTYNNATHSEVQDFVCKDGKLVEAKDEQDACNATFEKTDLCTYMKNKYMYNGTKWILYDPQTYCDEHKQEIECVMEVDEQTLEPIGDYCQYTDEGFRGLQFLNCLDPMNGQIVEYYCDDLEGKPYFKLIGDEQWTDGSDFCV